MFLIKQVYDSFTT